MRSSLTGIAPKKNISDGSGNADALAVPGHHGKQLDPVENRRLAAIFLIERVDVHHDPLGIEPTLKRI